jgi:hypothetical protein
MILTNDTTSREGTGTEPPSVQSLKHEDLEPVIGQLERQLRVLMLERAAILKRIGVIKKTVVGLVDLFGPNVINGELRDFLSLQSAPRSRTHPTLTDLCCQLLREASEPLTVRQILGQLQSPAALAGHKHRHNSLRTILKRLVAYGDAEPVLTEEGTRAWRSTSSSRSTGEKEF